MTERNMQKSYYVGCFLGAALGDALGTCQRRDRSTPGFTLPLSYGDLTQLAICTAKGLLEARPTDGRDINDIVSDELSESYHSWLQIQLCSSEFQSRHRDTADNTDKVGISDKAVKTDRAANRIGEKEVPHRGTSLLHTIDALKKNSKIKDENCALLDDYEGMLRVLPVGLLYPDNLSMAFKIGMMACAWTHEAPDAMLSSGFYAAVVSALARGDSIQISIERSLRELANHKGFESVNGAVITALYFVDDLNQEDDDAGREALLSDFIGKMNNSVKALDILTYSLVCVLLSPDDFRHGILKSIRYSSSPHATGMMTGSLLGLMLGENHLPDDWVRHLANKEFVIAVGEDLYDVASL